MHCVVIFTCVSIHHYVSNAIVISKCIHAIVINISLMHHKKKNTRAIIKGYEYHPPGPCKEIAF